jgi:hypothetical protein
MKHNPKPFSVEIKKSRIPGQRSHLPPRPLFPAVLAETTTIFQKEEPQAAAKPSAAPRILPSIVGLVWSSSEPVEPVHRKRSPVGGSRGQLEFNLNAGGSEGIEDAHAVAPVSAETVRQAHSVPVDAESVVPVYDVGPAQGGRVRAKSRKLRKKASEAVEQKITSEPTPEAQTAASSKVTQRRITKRLVAAAQLPRHERWKERLHPSAW